MSRDRGGVERASRASMRGRASRQIGSSGRRPCRTRSRTRRSPSRTSRPRSQDEPAVGDVVDGAGHVGQQVGVAVAVAGDQGADLDPLGHLGPGGQHRPALEVLAVGSPRRAGRSGPSCRRCRRPSPRPARRRADVVVLGVLGLELDGDADLRHTRVLLIQTSECIPTGIGIAFRCRAACRRSARRPPPAAPPLVGSSRRQRRLVGPT
jgi:hypothetical protein